jgi:hypothetical protein
MLEFMDIVTKRYSVYFKQKGRFAVPTADYSIIGHVIAHAARAALLVWHEQFYRSHSPAGRLNMGAAGFALSEETR